MRRQKRSCKHLSILERGVEAWNNWRKKNPHIIPDLSGADLSHLNLAKINFYKTRLFGANLEGANLRKANFIGADLRQANLSFACLVAADLNQADLSFATLKRANLSEADFTDAKLSNATLEDAQLTGALLVRTDLEGADLSGSRIFGISVWGVKTSGAKQLNLIITPKSESTITVDNLEIAQFIYLLLNNQKIRDVIDSITTKVVLILGRFSSERKLILDALRRELRQKNYVPVLFDFNRPANRSLMETLSILAHMSRFIIADITDPRSVPQELQAIVPQLAVPVQPILEYTKEQYSMFEEFVKYEWVLSIYYYKGLYDLLAALDDIIARVEGKAREMEKKLSRAYSSRRKGNMSF